MEEDFAQIGQYLFQITNIPPPFDYMKADFLISALEKTFNGLELTKQQGVNEKWNTLIDFIEDYFQGESLNIQELNEENIFQIYRIVVEIIENQTQDQPEQIDKMQINSYQKQNQQKQQKIKNKNQDTKIKEQQKNQTNIIRQKQIQNELNPTELLKPYEQNINYFKKQINKKVLQQKKQERWEQQSDQDSLIFPNEIGSNENLSLPLKKPFQKKERKQNMRPMSAINKTKIPIKDQFFLKNKNIVQKHNSYSKKKNIASKTKKNQTYFKNKKSQQQILIEKQRFQYYLKSKQLKNKPKQNLKQTKQIKKRKQDRQIKILALKQKNVTEQMNNEQLKFYLALRDKKLAYIKHMQIFFLLSHSLTQRLEKQKLRQKQKERKKMRKEQKQKQKIQLDKVNIKFENHMNQLKQAHQIVQNKRKTEEQNEVLLCRQLQKDMQINAKKQIQMIKFAWEVQNKKLQKITEDQQKIKNKLMKLYQKTKK